MLGRSWRTRWRSNGRVEVKGSEVSCRRRCCDKMDNSDPVDVTLTKGGARQCPYTSLGSDLPKRAAHRILFPRPMTAG
jgi:hypothetical protein